jgi:hypothetical protein
MENAPAHEPTYACANHASGWSATDRLSERSSRGSGLQSGA